MDGLLVHFGAWTKVAIRKGPRTHDSPAERSQADITTTKCVLWLLSPPAGAGDLPGNAPPGPGVPSAALERQVPFASGHSLLENEACDTSVGQAATIKGA